MLTDEKIINRFLDKIDFPETSDGCWEWNAYKFKGYGNFNLYNSYGETRAHRISWLIFREEPLVDGLELDHICYGIGNGGNRGCVNPAHLRQVPRKDNANNLTKEARLVKTAIGKKYCDPDFGSKKYGKANAGEKHGMAKLSTEDVLSIFALKDSGEAQQAIADRYNICTRYIRKIWNQTVWKHLWK